MIATVRVWSSTFKSDATKVHLAIISNYLDKEKRPYTRHTSIVNSSGTGKFRMVDEVATKIITVPTCLRADGSRDLTFRSSLICILIYQTFHFLILLCEIGFLQTQGIRLMLRGTYMVSYIRC